MTISRCFIDIIILCKGIALALALGAEMVLCMGCVWWVVQLHAVVIGARSLKSVVSSLTVRKMLVPYFMPLLPGPVRRWVLAKFKLTF